MGALGHFLEREGIPTVGISLVREHTETIRPPRALWVTFELGRPFGIPDDAPFQRRVLEAALDLLARTDGPLIADYPEHVDEEADLTGWACPINLAPNQTDSLAAEIDRLAVWYDRAVATHGRTTVGVSGLDMPAAGQLVSAALDGRAAGRAVAQGSDRRSQGLLSRSRLGLSRSRHVQDTARHGSGTRRCWRHGLLALQPKLAASADPSTRSSAT